MKIARINAPNFRMPQLANPTHYPDDCFHILTPVVEDDLNKKKEIDFFYCHLCCQIFDNKSSESDLKEITHFIIANTLALILVPSIKKFEE